MVGVSDKIGRIDTSPFTGNIMKTRLLKPVHAPGTCKRLTDGEVEMSLYPVIFGWRVRAGYVYKVAGYATYYLCDWCCGNDPMLIHVAYSAMKRLLQAGIELEELPTASAVKPWIKDPDFRAIMEGLADQYNIPAGPSELGVDVDFEQLRSEFMRKNML